MDGFRRFLATLGDHWRRLMIGRYGADQLSYALLAVSFVLLLLANITNWGIFSMLSFVTLAICYFRIFSRNSQRRYQENLKFLRFWEPIARSLSGMRGTVRDSRTHCHFRCPSCGQKIRVPRGRGKISITCPGCRTEFVRKT